MTSRWVHMIVLLSAYLWTNAAFGDQFDTSRTCRDDAGRFVACADVVSEPAVTPIVDPLPVGPAPGCEPKAEDEGSLRLRFSGGITMGKSSDVSLKPQPYVGIEAAANLTDFGGPSLLVNAQLLSYAGEAANGVDATNVKALDLSAALRQALGSHLKFGVYLKAGVATRLVDEEDTSARLPAYGSAGFDIRTEDGATYLQIGGGPDQRLTGKSAPSVHIEGRARIPENTKGTYYVTAGVIRALDLSAYGYGKPPSRDWWHISASAGW